jgi:hypothetical protein
VPRIGNVQPRYRAVVERPDDVGGSETLGDANEEESGHWTAVMVVG